MVALVFREDGERRRRATRQSIESFTDTDLANDRVVYVKNDNLPPGNFEESFTVDLTAPGVQPAEARVAFLISRDLPPSTVATTSPPSPTEADSKSDKDSKLLSEVIIPAVVGGFMLIIIVVILIILAMRSQRRRKMKVTRTRSASSNIDVPRHGPGASLTGYTHSSSHPSYGRRAIIEASTPTPPPPPVDEDPYRVTSMPSENARGGQVIDMSSSVADGDYMEISTTSTFAPKPNKTGHRERFYTLPKNFNSTQQPPTSYLVGAQLVHRSNSEKVRFAVK